MQLPYKLTLLILGFTTVHVCPSIAIRIKAIQATDKSIAALSRRETVDAYRWSGHHREREAPRVAATGYCHARLGLKQVRVRQNAMNYASRVKFDGSYLVTV